MKPSHLVLLLTMNFFWAAVYSTYKLIDTDLPTGGIVTLRFGIAALCFVLLWPWLPGPTPRGKALVSSCLMGLVLFVIGQRLQVYGNHLGTAGDSSILMALEPLITSVAAALFLREHIGPRRIIGFMLGLSGVALLHGIWRPDFHWTGLTASSIFVSSFVCEAAYSVMGKPVVVKYSVMKMLAISLVVGTAINFALDGDTTIAAAKVLPLRSWMLLLALAIVTTVIGYTVWFVVIRECPVNVAALTVFAQAVFGVIIAAVLLGEQPHWGQLWGSLMIVAGLVYGLSRQIHSPQKPAATMSQ